MDYYQYYDEILTLINIDPKRIESQDLKYNIVADIVTNANKSATYQEVIRTMEDVYFPAHELFCMDGTKPISTYKYNSFVSIVDEFLPLLKKAPITNRFDSSDKLKVLISSKPKVEIVTKTYRSKEAFENDLQTIFVEQQLRKYFFQPSMTRRSTFAKHWLKRFGKTSPLEVDYLFMDRGSRYEKTLANGVDKAFKKTGAPNPIEFKKMWRWADSMKITDPSYSAFQSYVNRFKVGSASQITTAQLNEYYKNLMTQLGTPDKETTGKVLAWAKILNIDNPTYESFLSYTKRNRPGSANQVKASQIYKNLMTQLGTPDKETTDKVLAWAKNLNIDNPTYESFLSYTKRIQPGSATQVKASQIEQVTQPTAEIDSALNVEMLPEEVKNKRTLMIAGIIAGVIILKKVRK